MLQNEMHDDAFMAQNIWKIGQMILEGNVQLGLLAYDI